MVDEGDTGDDESNVAIKAPVTEPDLSSDLSLEQAMQVLAHALARRERPADFSDPSLAALFDLQAEYVEDVGLEAIRQARRNGSDFVSVVDVENGDRAVRSGGRGRAWIEALGGILAGAGTGTFLQIAVDQEPSVLGLAISATIAAAGLVTTTAALFSRT